MCCKGDGVISDSVLLPFLFWNVDHKRVLPLSLCSGLQMGMGGGASFRAPRRRTLIRNASSRWF